MTVPNFKNTLRPAAVLATAAVAVLAGGMWLSRLNAPVGDIPREVRIRPGMSAGEIARMLERDGAIRSSFLFRVASRLGGYDGRFRSGRYTLPPRTGTVGAARFLSTTVPAPFDTRVTVPEGFNFREIASLFARKAHVDSTMFARFSSSGAVAESLGVDNATLEGYLYPDTYFVAEGAKAYDVIRMMIARFREMVPDSIAAQARARGFTLNQLVTLASLVETEAAGDDERPVIASIFLRRLKAGLPLQANPTVQYAIGEKRRLYEDDLKTDSPYNTYRYRGLPPGPIANPGMKSILAVLDPADTEYLYFVSNGDGGHVFSKTLAEHNSAVARYKKARNRGSR